MIQVKSKEEAIEWMRRCPNPHPGTETEIELRQVFEAADFAPVDPTGEQRKKQEELRAAVESRRS